MLRSQTSWFLRCWLFVSALLPLAFTAAAQPLTYRITDIASAIDPRTDSLAAAVNDAGEVVVIYRTGAVVYWKTGQPISLIGMGGGFWQQGFPPRVEAFFINANGTVAGNAHNGYDVNLDEQQVPGPATWSRDSGLQSINRLLRVSPLAQSTGFGYRVSGLTNQGSVGLLYDQGTAFEIVRGTVNVAGWGTPGRNFFYLNAAINNTGQMVAAFSLAQGTWPFCSEARNIGVSYHASVAAGQLQPFIGGPCNVGGYSIARVTAINDSGTAIGQALVFSEQLGRYVLANVMWNTRVQASQRPIPIPIAGIAINNAGTVLDASGATWNPTTGFQSLGIDPADPLRSSMHSFTARGINNLGQIIGDAYFVGRPRSAVLLTPSVAPPTIEMLDPSDNMIRGKVITDAQSLLAEGGRDVRGVAADGVATLLLRVRGAPANALVSARFKALKSLQQDGFLGLPGSIPNSDVVETQANADGAAYLLYRAPLDFSWESEHHNLKKRQVILSVKIGGLVRAVTIDVVRPPVVLVHGNWSNSTAWNHFRLPERFTTFKADYSSVMDAGVNGGFPLVSQQLRAYLNEYSLSESVVSVRADVVAHSMGGLVARAISMSSGARDDFRYGFGGIHKMITLNTPHHGSGFADSLLASNVRCGNLFKSQGLVVGQNIRDLATQSTTIATLSRALPTSVSIPTHAIVGSASRDQTLATEVPYLNPTFSIGWQLFKFSCFSLLRSGGFDALLGPGSDLIVSASSQSGVGLSARFPSGPIPYTRLETNVVHAVAPLLFPVGPDVLGRELVDGTYRDSVLTSERVIGNYVVHLLNRPVTDPDWFGEIKP